MENWGSSDSVVSIPSGGQRSRANSATGMQTTQSPIQHSATTPTAKPTHAPLMIEECEEEAEEWRDLDDQITARASGSGTSAAPTGNTRTKQQRHSTSGLSTTPTAGSSSHRKSRSSTGTPLAPTPRAQKLLPPPPSSGYGTARYEPSAALLQESGSSTLYAAFHGANAATTMRRSSAAEEKQPVKYLGMQTPKTEWLLPTRVSVAERTTTTVAAKASIKSPKADKSWKGYIPTNQQQGFDLRLFHPKVLDTPLPPPLPGTKNQAYDGPIQRVPVSEAMTRASLEKRAAKNARSGKNLTTAEQALEESIEARRAEKRARYEQEYERAKELLWQEQTSLEAKYQMLREERQSILDARAKVRAARREREEAWKREEMARRQKENLELRGPEARLAKYEAWFREEQERDLRRQYYEEHGQEAPEEYGKQTEVTEEEKELQEQAADLEVLEPAVLSTSAAALPSSFIRFPSKSKSSYVDQGRPVENYHGTYGIEFKMMSDNDPEAHAPLFADERQQQPMQHQQAVTATMAQPSAQPLTQASQHSRSPSTAHSRANSSIGQHVRGLSTGGAQAQAQEVSSSNDAAAGAGADEFATNAGDDASGDAMVPSGERKSASGMAESFTPELSATLARQHSEQDSQVQQPQQGVSNSTRHVREASHSARGVAFAPQAGDEEEDLISRTSRMQVGANAAAGGADQDMSREASRSQAHRGILRKSYPGPEESVSSMHQQGGGAAGTGSVRGSSRNGRSLALSVDEMADDELINGSPSASGEVLGAEEEDVLGTPRAWDAEEKILAGGIDVIKIPRTKGLFAPAPKRVTLFLERGGGGVKDLWLLRWTSKKKKSDDEFVNISEMHEFHRGMAHGSFKDSKDLAKKYADREQQCFTLVLPATSRAGSGGTLDLVVLEEKDAHVFQRILARIVHPSGMHRTPRASSAASAEFPLNSPVKKSPPAQKNVLSPTTPRKASAEPAAAVSPVSPRAQVTNAFEVEGHATKSLLTPLAGSSTAPAAASTTPRSSLAGGLATSSGAAGAAVAAGGSPTAAAAGTGAVAAMAHARAASRAALATADEDEYEAADDYDDGLQETRRNRERSRERSKSARNKSRSTERRAPSMSS